MNNCGFDECRKLKVGLSKNDKAEMKQSIVNSVAGGSPKEVFDTYEDLVAKYPTGRDGVFLVKKYSDLGKAGYWYFWNELVEPKKWDEGGEYLASVNIDNLPIASETILGGIKISGDFDISTDGVLTIYKPIVINSFTNNKNVVALGTTINSIILNWDLSKEPITQEVNGIEVANDLRTKTITEAITNNKTFTLIVNDGKTEKTSTTSITFMNYVLYGKGATFDESKLTKELRNTRVKTFEVSAGANDYIYYSIPSRLGTPTFFVGGFEGGFELLKTYQWDNGTGYKEEYKVYKSKNKNLGTTKVEVK